jgi:hypothetical protein
VPGDSPNLAAVLRLCDSVVEAIRTILAASEIEATSGVVQRLYLPDVLTPKNLGAIRVDVYPLRYGEEDAGGDRGSDPRRYTIGIDVWGRYTGSEPQVPLAWLDSRVLFCEQLYDSLGDPRYRAEPVLGGEWADTWPSAGEVAWVYDPDRLHEHRIFLSSLEITYRRDEE